MNFISILALGLLKNERNLLDKIFVNQVDKIMRRLVLLDFVVKIIEHLVGRDEHISVIFDVGNVRFGIHGVQAVVKKFHHAPCFGEQVGYAFEIVNRGRMDGIDVVKFIKTQLPGGEIILEFRIHTGDLLPAVFLFDGQSFFQQLFDMRGGKVDAIVEPIPDFIERQLRGTGNFLDIFLHAQHRPAVQRQIPFAQELQKADILTLNVQLRP